MATNLTGTTIASTYEKLLKRADTYVAAGVNIEVQNDSAVAAASSLYLDITNGNIGIGDTLPSEAKLSIGSVAASDYGLKIDNDQNTTALYIDADGVTSGHTFFIDAPTTTTGRVLLVNDCDALTTGSVALLTSNSDDVSVRNLVHIINDNPLAVGATALYIKQDSTGPAISATGGIVEEGGALKENLLTNSGFDVWSNSALANVGSAVWDDDDDGGSGGVDVWNAASNAFITFDTDHYVYDNGAGSANIYSDNFTTVVGKLYKLSISVKQANGNTCFAGLETSGGADLEIKQFTSTSSYVIHTVVAEATTTSTRIVFYSSDNLGGAGGAAFVEFKNTTVYEVTPGITDPTGNCLCFDGWSAGTSHSGLEFFRQENIDVGHASNKTNSKLGSFYALKINFIRDSSVFSGAVWPGPLQHTTAGSGSVDPVHLERFRGKTVTLGCWVKSSTTGKGGIAIDDADTKTTAVTTGTSWEWLEVTDTIGDTSVSFDIHLLSSPVADGSYITYFSQPMLVFGSSIGSGNYTRPQSEIVWFETRVILTDYNNDSVSSDADINLEAQSNGRIPKGAKAVYAKLTAQCSAADQYILLNDGDEADALQLQSQVANVNNINTGWVPCDNVGDINIARGNTFTGVYIRTYGVQLR